MGSCIKSEVRVSAECCVGGEQVRELKAFVQRRLASAMTIERDNSNFAMVRCNPRPKNIRALFKAA